MEISQFDDLAKFRILIGYLGEREQFGWWQSSFYAPGSEMFLTPVFSRTHALAQCTGTTRAAQLIHDERIGVGNVYHLFRLPEEIEQGIHKALHNSKLTDGLKLVVTNKQSALEMLKKYSTPQSDKSVGPIRIGNTATMRDSKIWKTAIGYYIQAFEQESKIFPYFSDIA